MDTLESKLKVPHATADATSSPDVRTLLEELRGTLTQEQHGAQRLPFRRYALLVWLLKQDVSDVDAQHRPAVMGRRLRDHHRDPAGQNTGQNDGTAPQPLDQLGTVAGVPWSWILRLVPAVVLRVVVSGRVPGIGRPYRWFMRQPYLSPVWSKSFVDFAQRLTAPSSASTPPRDMKNARQIEKLLVHAFLQDLRQAHARSPWWRLRGWRRTTCPVAVLSGVERGNAGHELLKLIAAVREETGQPDPLLLVCGGDQSIADCPEMGAPVPLYEVPKRPTQRRYVPVRMPVRPQDAEGADDSEPVVASQPPLFARAGFVMTVCLTLLLSAVGWGALALGVPNCWHPPFSGRISLRSTPHGCIGYSDSAGYVFNDQPGQGRLRQAQETIYAQNEEAQRRWEDGGRQRPYVTLVYLGSLTGRPVHPDEEAYPAEREELEGLIVAQHRGLQQSVSAYRAPLLRVVLANAAFQMTYAGAVVDMIDALAREESDAPVIGVIGLVESRTNTAAALRRLNAAGIPAIAPTLSADRMDLSSRLFLQVASPNRDQSRMMAAYARTVLHVSRARVYVTSGRGARLQDDLYVSTLRRDLKKDLGKMLEYDREWSGGDLSGECGYSGMLVFAGRWSEFNEFVQALDTNCATNQPRHLVADDSVNRYMANDSLRKSAPANLPLTYVTKAALANCQALEARADRDNVANTFLRAIRTKGLLTSPGCTGKRPKPVGERVGLTYDGAQMMLQGVENLVARARVHDQLWNPRLITPAAVHAEVLLHQNQIEPFYGVTGSAEFPPGRGEPVNKRISLFRVKDMAPGHQPTEVFHCGGVRSDDPGGCVVPRS